MVPLYCYYWDFGRTISDDLAGFGQSDQRSDGLKAGVPSAEIRTGQGESPISGTEFSSHFPFVQGVLLTEDSLSCSGS